MASDPTKKSDSYYYVLAIRMAADLTITIAAPALIAAFAGVKLDATFGTKPYLFFTCLSVALVLTAIIVVRKAKRYAKQYR